MYKKDCKSQIAIANWSLRRRDPVCACPAEPLRLARSLAMRFAIPTTLIDRLGLPDALREPARTSGRSSFRCWSPISYLRRMRPGDVNDPLLRQVLPLEDELTESPGFVADPVGDAAAHRSARSAAQVRRARPADRDRLLRRPLPVLLSARVSVSAGTATAATTGRRHSKRSRPMSRCTRSSSAAAIR